MLVAHSYGHIHVAFRMERADSILKWSSIKNLFRRPDANLLSFLVPETLLNRNLDFSVYPRL